MTLLELKDYLISWRNPFDTANLVSELCRPARRPVTSHHQRRSKAECSTHYVFILLPADSGSLQPSSQSEPPVQRYVESLPVHEPARHAGE